MLEQMLQGMVSAATSNTDRIKYVAVDADGRLKMYLRQQGYGLRFVSTHGIVGDAISNHPDVFMCKLGYMDDSPVIHADEKVLGPEYPDDVRYNAACTGKYFIHNLKYTAPELLQAAKEMGMQFIDVKQGYAKCSIVVVDEDSIITYDNGIADACEDAGMEVLRICPGFVNLPGYDTGFIGGTAGLIPGEVVFNGNLEDHPNYPEIEDFINEHGLTCRWFPDYPLTDIGSII